MDPTQQHDAHRTSPNRLAKESSPYLLQHAHNPVEWWPWGPEAFAEARRRDVPIFLSIGYSTCYWCHVMERESFEDPATAKVMNARFVNIKVDREERPDVDDLYMAAVQMLTGHGGWPMSVFLEPNTLRPFWGGTYFPPEERHGLPAFTRALEGMSDAFAAKRDDVTKQAGAIAAAVAERLSSRPAAVRIGRPQVAMAVQTLLTILDRTHGGFSDQPKFPQPVYLELLLDVREKTTDPTTRGSIDHALRLTLDKMAQGGMFDQVGGGFHRYSVDRHWIVPHFEKMLYDQGQLLSVYARAAKVFDDPFYARTARRIAGYVLNEMTGPGGAFFTAQDAEVDGREGLSFLWQPEQIEAVLGAADGEFICELYGLTGGPNFQDPHHPNEPARSVLHLSERPEKTAAKSGVSAGDLFARIDRCNARLLAARNHRKQPRLDDKVVTAWNGLMIAGLARAARHLPADDQLARFTAAAVAAADAVLASRRADGQLPRSTRAGAGTSAGVLEDYGAMILGLAELALTLGDSGARFISAARQLWTVAQARFGDGKGGLFDAPQGREDLFTRARSTYDGAMPCGSSLMACALVRLGEAARDRAMINAAAAIVASISPAVEESPIATANTVRALLSVLDLDEPSLVAALEAAGAAPMPGGNPAPGHRLSRGPAPVEVYASTELLEIAPDAPAEFFLQVRIADGHHVTAAQHGTATGDDARSAFRVGVVGGGGIAVYADYPPGQPWETDPAVLVYTGTIEMRVAVECTGDLIGPPRIAVAYQACTQRECHAPAVAELEVEIRLVPATPPAV